MTERQDSMQKKRVILTAAGFLICGVIAVVSAVSGSATAYLSDKLQINNQFTIGKNTTTIEEEFPTPTPVPPGGSVTKKVSVRNQGDVPCYVRVMLTFSEDNVSLEGGDTENWVVGEDGYYYYTHVVEVGDSTTDLFDSVTINGEAEATEIRVNVYEESVQTTDGSVTYEDYEEAWAHYGGGE